MMNKTFKLSLVFLMLLIVSSFAFAVDTTDNEVWVSLQNSTESIALYDWSENGNNFTNNGATYDANSNDYVFNGVNSYLDASGIPARCGSGEDLTISLWANFTTFAFTNDMLVDKRDANNDGWAFFRDVDNKLQFANNNEDTISTAKVNANQTYHLVAVSNRTSNKVSLYINGVEVSYDAQPSITTCSVTNNARVGMDAYATSNQMDGRLSGISVFNRSLSSTEIAQLYAEGRDYNPHTVPVQTGTYVPKVTEANQIGVATITSTAYTPVLIGTVNVTEETNITATLTGSVLGNGGSSEANCEINFNNTQIGFTTTTPPNNKYRSIFINTNFTDVTSGEYNVTVSCKRDSVSSFDAENFKLLITQYVNSNDKQLNKEYYEEDYVLSTSDYTLVNTLYFNTTNLTLDNGTTRYVLFEASLNNQYDSTGTLCIKGGALSINTSDYCRYGLAGSTGSGSAFTIISEAPTNTTIPLDIYAKSSTSDGIINLTINSFEIISHPDEVNQTQLVNIPINSTDWEILATRKVSNNNHVSTSFVTKGSLVVKSNASSSDMQFRFRLNSGSNQTGTTIYRDVSLANQEGIVSLQEDFINLPIGDYTVYLEGKASNYNSYVTGGQMVIYPSNDVPFGETNFNITAKDYWTNETIYNFSANLNGLIAVSDEGTGIIQAPVIDSLIDIIIIRDGHPNKTISDHNPILPLEVNLGNNYVAFYDSNTTAPLTDSDILVNLDNGSTLDLITNSTGFIEFEYYGTNYNITYDDKQGYITPITFEYDAIETPFNISYNISRANLTVNIYDSETGSLIDEYAEVSLTGLGNVNTSNGTITIVNLGLTEGEYTVYVSSENYTYNQKTFTYTNQEELVVSLYVIKNDEAQLGTVFVNVYDSYLDVVAGADLRLQELDPDTSSFVEVGQRISSSAGSTSFQVLLNERTYRIYATFTVNGVTYSGYSIAEGEVFYADGQNIPIYLDTIEAVDYRDYEGLSVEVTNTNLTNNISYHQVDFIDTNGLDHTICLRYSYLDGVIKTTSEEICLTGSSGTINYNESQGYLLNRNYTWVVDAYIKEGNYKRYEYTQTYKKANGFSEIFEFILKALLGTLILGALAVALYLERIDYFIYLAIFLAILWLIIAPSYVTLRFLGLVVVISWFVLDLAKKKTNSEED